MVILKVQDKTFKMLVALLFVMLFACSIVMQIDLVTEGDLEKLTDKIKVHISNFQYHEFYFRFVNLMKKNNKIRKRLEPCFSCLSEFSIS